MGEMEEDLEPFKRGFTNDHDSMDQQRDWICSICGKYFKYPYSLMRHMATHSKERRYRCDRCPKAFRQMSTLSQHKATHSSARPYSCEICGKAFNRGSTLISHRRTHQMVKRFSCSVCRKSFHQKGNLVNHIYTHTNERPYRCDICFKGFNQKSNLVCHMYTLHGQKKSYRCDFCPVSFSRENAYRAHLNACHRLGPASLKENTFPLSRPDKLSATPRIVLRNNILDGQQCGRSHVPSASTLQSMDLNRSKLRINVLTSPKKPIIRIPALPIMSDLTNKFFTRNEDSVSVKDTVPLEQVNRGENTDIIVTNVGDSLLIQGKAPRLLEETWAGGHKPYLLVLEPVRPPRLCRAHLCSDGFIVSPVTGLDFQLLSAEQSEISIVMTIRRRFEDGQVKTFIFMHQPPLTLSILLRKSTPDECSAENTFSLDPQYTLLNERKELIGPEGTQSPNHSKPHLKGRRPEGRFSDSENIIRFHLSQVGFVEESVDVLSSQSEMLKTS